MVMMMIIKYKAEYDSCMYRTYQCLACCLCIRVYWWSARYCVV